MRILITNDDGIYAEGIGVLIESLLPLGEVVVVAPESEQSGKSHSFTYRSDLYVEEITDLPCPAYAVRGTPADCVKVSCAYLHKDNLPDIVVSGINRGENLGIASFYSGTVGAAREGAFWRIPAIAFSIAESQSGNFGDYVTEVRDLFMRFKDLNTPGTFLNINFPPCPPKDIRGVKVCRQSLSYYNGEYIGKREGRSHLLTLTNNMVEIEKCLDYDIAAAAAGYTTVTPLSIDGTSTSLMDGVKQITELFELEER